MEGWSRGWGGGRGFLKGSWMAGRARRGGGEEIFDVGFV